jgi:hypothetical protein
MLNAALAAFELHKFTDQLSNLLASLDPILEHNLQILAKASFRFAEQPQSSRQCRIRMELRVVLISFASQASVTCC